MAEKSAKPAGDARGTTGRSPKWELDQGKVLPEVGATARLLICLCLNMIAIAKGVLQEMHDSH